MADTAARLKLKASKLQRENERLEVLLKQAWLLGDDLIDNVKPGDEEKLTELLNRPFENPLLKRDANDIERPDVHILRLMRNPEYFPFTCKHLLNITILPLQHVILKELWSKPFPMLIGSRGMGKSFILALYMVLRALVNQGTKIVIVGAAFRQAKVVFEYVEQIWSNAPILRDLCGGGKGRNNREQGPRRDIDRCECIIGDSVIIALPLGDGKKIRGQRANIIVADEFACVGSNTLVETDLGLMRIAESKQEMGSFVLNTGCQNGEVAPADFIETPPTDVYRITTMGGYSFDCSAIHTVMTTQGWRIAQELTPSDYLVFENTYRFPTQKVEKSGLVVDEELAWLMGMLTAEGSINSRHAIQVHTTDRSTVEHVRDALGRLMPPERVGVCSAPAYKDKRGWNCKESFTTYCCNLQVREQLLALGLDRATASDKKVPWSILRSPREVVLAYLSGLFDGDGSAFLWKSRGKDNHLGVAFYSTSEQLCQEVQVLLAKLGLFATRQSRKSKLSDRPQWFLRLNGEDAHRLCCMLNVPRWAQVVATACPPAGAGTGVIWDGSRKKWKAEIYVDGRMKYLGRFETREEAESCVAANKPLLSLRVRSVVKLPEKQVLYDYHVPNAERFLGGGFLQHNSIPPDIYETVVKGFGSVSQDPIGNVQDQATVRLLKKLGRWSEEMDAASYDASRGNQSILSGTAYYSFNWFYKYWNRYKTIIESRGDPVKLAELDHEGKLDPNLNWRDYSIIRIPVDLLPAGLMDLKIIASSRAMSHHSIHIMEYGAVFAKDSDGFFKRSLIESCVAGNPENNIGFTFSAGLCGDVGIKHIIGVDPASQSDNFAVVVVALHGDHRRVVYCWTTKKKDFQRRQQEGLTREKNFFAFVARKIRELMKLFVTERIVMDSQGGGYMVEEALHDEDKLQQGELPIWQVKDPDPKKRKDSDNKKGLHILELVHFANAVWTSDANNGLKKDMEDKALLFPYMNAALLGLSVEEDKELKRTVDTLEDATMEIEALKDELVTIQHTQTPTGRDHWDVPAIKGEGSKKGRLRKDRYSALLMANMAARQMERGPQPTQWEAGGGWAGDIAKRKGGDEGAMYVLGEGWGEMPDDDLFGRAVTRGGW